MLSIRLLCQSEEPGTLRRVFGLALWTIVTLGIVQAFPQPALAQYPTVNDIEIDTPTGTSGPPTYGVP